ncbi:TolC family protein [Allorhodopirellula solitaria]|uniref:TolC family protein n=1 Tax=Allorhodopirellula solitaria TaxID=2527987 RepID=UPI001FE3EE70|nr:TolC family protein [Allorhodopirellula solitaria]
MAALFSPNAPAQTPELRSARQRATADSNDSESFANFLSMVQDDEREPAQTAAPLPNPPASAPATARTDGAAAGPPQTLAPGGNVAPANVVGSPDTVASPEIIAAPEGVAAEEAHGESLTLADVVASLYQSFPKIEQARQLQPIAQGDLTSAYGTYDTKFYAESLSEPTGYYRNYRNELGLARRTWWGGYLSAGYRIGRGYYQPWYKGRQTDDAGEFKIKAAQPLLRGRAIDAERVAVFQASLQREAALPRLQQTILETSRQAIDLYWKWVSAGSILQAQRELWELAEKRGKQYEVGVRAGKFAEIDLILNQQLIAERRALLLKAEQKFRELSFKLGLYLRDETGQPMPPDHQWLPKRFPDITPQPPIDLQADLTAAISRRPEPELLQLEMRSTQWDRRLADNDLLPNFDFISEASQDMGEQATYADDKGEFELMIGFESHVPIQRRKARGKIQSTSAKLNQIDQKLRLTYDKIAVELQTQSNRLQLATQIARELDIALEAALETLQRYRFAFDSGKIDLIYLNLLETKVNETEIKLIEAQREWFSALAELQLALALDPLDQAMLISDLPESQMLGPGHLEVPPPPDAEQLEADWKRHRNAP